MFAFVESTVSTFLVHPATLPRAAIPPPILTPAPDRWASVAVASITGNARARPKPPSLLDSKHGVAPSMFFLSDFANGGIDV